MKAEKSCGIIPVFKNNDEWNVILIQQNNGVIGFPKGHVEKNETEEETALRECFEETHLSVQIVNGFKEEISYFMTEYDAYKTVVFFLGIINSFNLIKQKDEIINIYICTLDEALNKISYDDTKEILKKAIDYLNNV